MTFYYSMKQMLRSPLKSFLFFLLVGVSALFLAMGGNLWNMSRAAFEEFEGIFTTIGTVEQVTNPPEIHGRWDAGRQAYQYFKSSSFGERIPEGVLDFEGAGYILPPRQRPYFGAYVDDLYQGLGRTWLITVEVTPIETAVADHSIKMRIVKVLEGNLEAGDVIYICEHDNPNPSRFEAGKSYVMQLNQGIFIHGEGIEDEPDEYAFEYWLQYDGIKSTQYTLDGKKIKDSINEDEKRFDEVTEGFYETDRGKRWLKAGREQDYADHTVPVQPTDGTKLLMPFYRDDVVIEEGRDITKEEYESGAKVCLIPDTLAILLRKSLGEKLNLPLYYANYRTPPAFDFNIDGGSGLSFKLINAEGESYSVFNEQEYEIVGIYTVKEKGAWFYGIGRYEVVIPWNAVPENSWKNNIVAYGPMLGSTTSFQIPNGTIQDFWKLWEKQGIDDLEITFYDKGYTQLKEGIDNRKMMSWIFLISGIVLAVMILLFFSNLFITGQQERIAVERLLGRTKKQCAASILTGLLVLAAIGSIMGSVAGWKATEIAAKKADTEIIFDTSYSNNVIDSSGKEKVTWSKPSLVLAFGTGGGLILAAFLITSCYMRENLKKEPLQLLGEIEE